MTIEVQGNKVGNIETLQKDHEEADSRMFNQARYLLPNNQIWRIIIPPPDTDVFIIACFQFIKSSFPFSELCFETAYAKSFRYVAVHDICKKYGATFCMSLPVAHALTGCESTSSFTGVGKKTVVKILQTKIGELQSLYDLGDLLEVQMKSDAVNNTIKFVISLYDKTADTDQINEILYKLFAQKKF